jgi:hypothetical protein
VRTLASTRKNKREEANSKGERMKKLYVLLLLVFVLTASYGQTVNLTGAQILRSARSIYDQGRLHELPAILEDGFAQEKFNDNEKVEAYKILILTYIYIEEPEKADAAMISLLDTDPFFSLSKADPVEFKNLYRKFRTAPLFRAGVKGGVNQTMVNTLKNYFIPATSGGKGTYKSDLGFHGALIYEKDLTKKFEKFVLAPELAFVIQSFTYENSSTNNVDFEDKGASLNHKITHTRLQLNPIVQYKLVKIGEDYDDKNKRLVPLVFAGPSISYLLSSSFAGQNTLESKESSLSGTIDNTDSYKSLTISVIAGAGARLKIGGIYLVGDIRFQYGLFNAVNGDNRYRTSAENSSLLFDYQYVDNDFKLSLASVNLGLMIPVFKPIKLIK